MTRFAARHVFAALALLPQPSVHAAEIADVELFVVNTLPFVDVAVAGNAPVRFLIDTGADVTVIDSAYAQRLQLPAGPSKKEAAPGGAVEVATLPPLTLKIGDVEFPGINAVAVPISGMNNVIGLAMAGIIGHDMLSRFVFDLDYPAGRLRLHTAGDWQYQGEGIALPVHFLDNQTLVMMRMAAADGRRINDWFKLDTGSMDVVGLATNAVEQHRLVTDATPMIKLKGVAMGGDTEARLFRLHSVELGDSVISQPAVGYVVDSAGFERRKFAGVVGGQMLSPHRLLLDYEHNRIIMEGKINRRADENRSGLFVVANGASFDQLVVAQVYPGSAGEAAGIRVGDEVLSIDGKRLSLAEMRDRLAQPGRRELSIRRGQEEMRAVLHNADLLPLVPGGR